ncbi:restriction endonuclease subunit S [Microbacterium sp.]|uniref:restriction endonuclease subunit S n=1 Tax=Microbacterium sp. TaxID=51671 RepID=UPI0025E19914|nr:restriction endonuclease subunit S [Microbacterium sp.]
MTTVRVGDIAHQIRGVTYAKGDASDVPLDTHVALLRAGNIGEFGLLMDDLIFVPKARVSPRQMLQPDDVLIAASSGSLSVVGKAARVVDPIQGSFGAFCKVLRPTPGVDPAYFAHFFRTSDYRRHISSVAAGANINNLRGGDLDRIEIPLPPLPEQRRIAAILDEADALRERKSRAVHFLQALEVSTFRDRVARLQTQRVRLRSVAITTSGGTPSRSQPENFGGAVPWVKSGEVAQGIVTSTSETITELALQRSSAKVMPAGTVVIAMYGATAGEVGVLGVDAATNQAVCSITPAESLDAGFLRRSLLAMKEDLKSKAVGGAQPNLSQGMIRDINLDLPAVAEQRAVVQICDEPSLPGWL